MALNFPDNPTINQVYSDSTSGFYYKWDGQVWQSYSPSSAANIKTLDDISSSFNGIGQTFGLTSGGVTVTPLNAGQLVINLGGVVQSPSIDYTVSSSNITFTTPPGGGLSFSGISLGPAVVLTDIASASITPDKLSTGAPWWQTNYNVGIGTTLPTSALAVIGNASITGVITANTFNGQINSGFATITSAIVGAGVTINNAGIVAVGVITANTFVGNINGNVSGNVNGNVVGNINSTGISTITNLITTSITSQNLRVSGITTLGSSNGIGTVTIGTGITALLVDGNARITGILSIGQGTITLNGNTNTISGVSSISDATGSYLSTPPGTVITVAASTAPTGYLKANGASLSTTTYASLFSTIGYTFGGSGASFTLPDLRGEFIRGWADNRVGIDTGTTFGRFQDQAFLSHSHGVNDPSHGHTYARQDYGAGVQSGADYIVGAPLNQETGYAFTNISIQNNGGAETRPRNIALLYCIKY